MVDPADPLASADLRTIFAPSAVATETEDAAAPPTSGPSPVDPTAPPAATTTSPRYELRAVLGRGGMGEVRLCRDTRIGRDVAVKLALPRTRGDVVARGRFLREARVQGQLEHPTVVPVHDLEVLADGSAYFTMKRVRGETLATLLRDGPDRPSRRRLLAALATVCLGVEFAHQRGVVHRDLKPANIMLGDFGETWVLDWGLAKIVDVLDEHSPSSDDVITPSGAHTVAGSMLGTPGYMAPEQLDASIAPVSARTDVYALGAILFEVLTGQPVVQSRERAKIVRDTLAGVDARASVRAPDADVPPELEAVCVRALARDPVDRFPTARALHDAVDAFLEGAQDRERRRAASARHASAAAVALGDDDEERGRAVAMRELGRALAYDADNDEARRSMLRLLTDPPRATPREVAQRIDAADAETVRTGAQLNLPVVSAWLLFVPLGVWIGVREWLTFGVAVGALALSTALTYALARRPNQPFWLQVATFVLTNAAYVASARLLGPFVLAPTLIATYAVVLQTHPHARERRWALAISCVAIVASFALEVSGWVPPSYAWVDGRMIVEPRLLDLREGPTTALLCAGFLAGMVGPALFLRRIRVALTDAERRLQVQSWQLERLVAGETQRRAAGSGAIVGP